MVLKFRRWANEVLKEYIIEGYAVNNSRLEALEQTVEIQSRMLSSVLKLDGNDVLLAVNQYTKALSLLDQYDHQSIRQRLCNIFPVAKIPIPIGRI